MIRHKSVQQKIVDQVILKNRDHQIDENSILIDRQGIFARYKSDGDSIDVGKKKYESAHRLLELAAVISKVILDGGLLELENKEQLSIRNLICNPDIVFIKSVTAYKTWSLLLDEFQLKSLLEHSIQNNSENKDAKSGKITEWTDGHKWIMGIIGSIIVPCALLFTPVVQKEFNHIFVNSISLLTPIDGYNKEVNEKYIYFSWEVNKNANRYVLVIEMYDESKQKWAPASEVWRFVVKENKKSVYIKKVGRYRWKIIPINNIDENICESVWYYFETLIPKVIDKKI